MKRHTEGFTPNCIAVVMSSSIQQIGAANKEQSKHQPCSTRVDTGGAFVWVPVCPLCVSVSADFCEEIGDNSLNCLQLHCILLEYVSN